MDELMKEKLEKALNKDGSYLRSPECMKVKAYLLDEMQKPFSITMPFDDWELGFLARISKDTVPERFIDFLMYENNLDSYDRLRWATELIGDYFEFVLKYQDGVYEQKLLDFIHSIPMENYNEAYYCYKKIIEIDNKYMGIFIDFLKQAIIVSQYDTSFNSTRNGEYITFIYCNELKALIDKKSYEDFVVGVFIESLKKHYDTDGNENYRAKYSLPVNILIELKKILNEKDFIEVFTQYTNNSNIHKGYIEFLSHNFSEKLDEYLPIVLKKSFNNLYSSELEALFKIVTFIEFKPYYDLVWKLAIGGWNLANRDATVKQIIETLEIHKELCLKYASKGLKAKGKQENYLSFLILFDNPSEAIKPLLKEAFHLQTDDKNIRNHFLNEAQKIFYDKELYLDEVNEVIDYAQKRKKLSKWKESFALEEMPALYFKNGEQVTPLQLHFLFYRLQQAYEMQQDVEAMLLIDLIDKQKAQPALQFLLQHFINNGGKVKEKYLMSLAALLGDESLFNYLTKLFQEVFDAKRMKMAQFVIGAIALIGSDKALRFIDFVSRKHKKKTALRDYCLESLDSAAKALNITRYELYDKLIPDFGFDGIYKFIEIEGEEWRVYVGKDFKLFYVDESNKVKKSLPSKAPKEIKDELKEVQKEIREVNKTQVDKLEQYMVVERIWKSAAWQKFYLYNPLMFIYASTLVWELIDEDGNQEMLFYIDEDGSAMSIDGDELSFEDMENKTIKIIHPLHLSDEQKEAWQALFYDLEIVQPFLQLQRPIFFMQEHEKSTKGLNRYNDKKFAKGESAIKTLLERRGYEKDVVDSGCIDFYKEFAYCDIRVELGLFGVNVVYYDGGGDMEMSETVFKDKQNNAMTLEAVPKIVFSETVYDLDVFMED